MGEEVIHGILLTLHNIALVGCVAAPRGQEEISHELKKTKTCSSS